MNSIKALQALNLVVNHDICPQMKRLRKQNIQLLAWGKKGQEFCKMVKDKTIKILAAAEARYTKMETFLNERGYFPCAVCAEIFEFSADGVGETTEGVCCGICFENHPENATD